MNGVAVFAVVAVVVVVVECDYSSDITCVKFIAVVGVGGGVGSGVSDVGNGSENCEHNNSGNPFNISDKPLEHSHTFAQLQHTHSFSNTLITN